MSGFVNLNFLSFYVNDDDWLGTAKILQPLQARLSILCMKVSYKSSLSIKNSRRLVEDSRVEAMRTDGLELLEPVLLRDNFADLHRLQFEVGGYRDKLDPLRESILETIRQKLPKMYGRASLHICLVLKYAKSRPTSQLNAANLHD